MTLSLLSLALPQCNELEGSEITEGLVRPDGVSAADLIPGLESFLLPADLDGQVLHLVELLLPRLSGAVHCLGLAGYLALADGYIPGIQLR